MKAVILAGGFGTRLAPLTNNTPKPLMPVLGKPIIGHIVGLLKQHNVKEISVTLKHFANQIIDYLACEGVGDFFVEEEPLGTAGSVKNALMGRTGYNGLEGSNNPFFVISGDCLTDVDLTAVATAHALTGAMVTMVTQSATDVTRFGVVVQNGEGRVLEFQEKPKKGEELSNTINCGIYLVNPEVFKLVPKGFFDFSKDLFPLMLKKNLPIYTYRHTGYWQDIGCVNAFHSANMDALAGRIKLERMALQGGINIINSVVPANVYVSNNVLVINSVVFEGAEVVSNTINSVVSTENIVACGETLQIIPCKNSQIGI